MANYLDIFVVPVPTKSIETYCKHAELYLKVLRDLGALSCVEVEADDAPFGKLTSFPRSVDLKSDETVFVGIVEFRSRAHRDEVNAKLWSDPRMAGLMDPKLMTFDAKRMFWGGFKPFAQG